MTVCPVNMTQEEYDAIAKCEAVVLREYEREDGDRFAIPAAWGDADEMKEKSEIPSIFVVPVGLTIICHKFMLVADLLGENGDGED